MRRYGAQMQSPWEPIAIGLVVWAMAAVAAGFSAMYDTSAAVLIGAVVGGIGALPLSVGLVALGVRLGVESARNS